MGGIDAAASVNTAADSERAATTPSIESVLHGGRRALDDDGDTRAERQWFEAAYSAAEAIQDPVAMGEATLGLAGLWVHEQRTATAHTLLLWRMRHALAALDPESSLGLRLRLRITAETEYGNGAAETLALAEQVRLDADVAMRAEAANLVLQCIVGPDHTAVRHTLAELLIADGMWHSRHSDVLLGMMWRTVNLLLDGDVRAERSRRELRAMLDSHDHVAVHSVVDAIDVMRRIRAGQLDAAESHASQLSRQGWQGADPHATERHGLQLLTIRWYQGRIGELTPMLGDLVDAPDVSMSDHACLGALALAAASCGDERQARHVLARLNQVGLAALPRCGNWLVALYGAVEAAHLLGDQATAAEAYDLLLPYADRPAMAGLGVACLGSVQHSLGIAALTQNEPDRAVAHLTAAVHANLTWGHWPATILARTRLAQALDWRNHPADPDRARRERQTATRDADELGLPRPDPEWSPTAAGNTSTLTPRRSFPPSAICRRTGPRWEITVGSDTVRINQMRGLQHLAILLANPGQEIRATELATGPTINSTSPIGRTTDQPILDETARRDYRRRLADLDAHIDQHELAGDIAQTDRLRDEREWLLSELATATGFAGRPRTFPTSDERARIAVGKTIWRAIHHISKANRTLGEHLNNTIRTGVRCSYQP